MENKKQTLAKIAKQFLAHFFGIIFFLVLRGETESFYQLIHHKKSFP